MMKPKKHFLLLLTAVAFLPAASAQQPSLVETAPPRELVIQIEVPAPVHDVWQAFTTSEG